MGRGWASVPPPPSPITKHLLVVSARDSASSATLSNKLEFVQRLCTKRWSDSPTSLMSSLNWPTLCLRRSRQKSQLCRWIIRYESIDHQPIFLLPPPPPPSQLNPRASHSLSVNVTCARTSAFCPPSLYWPADCGTASPRTWSTYHLLVLF